MNEDDWRDSEPLVRLADMRSCNGTVAAGGHLVHSRHCPVHGDTTQRDLDAELADLTAAAEARGYRKAITAPTGRRQEQADPAGEGGCAQ